MRQLVNMSLEELQNHPQVPIIIECDDGEVETIIEEIILSWFLWELHREWPATPHLTTHHFAGVIITPYSHLNILGVIQKDCFFANRKDEYESLLEYNKVVFRAYNNLYNFMAGELTGYMTSISILDYIEVMNYPPIKEVNEWIQGLEHVNDRDIETCYKKVEEVLTTPGVLEDNALKRAYMHRIVPIAQIWQDVTARGYVNDIDSHILPKPIRTGYAEGIRELSDFIAESRTATLAEIMTGSPMQASEYLNRLLQLSVSRVKKLEKVDCGSEILVDWFVDTKKKLGHMEGIYYLNEDTGQQEPIVPSEHQHLVGQSIKIRTVFGCQLSSRDSICARCFGDLAHSIHDTDNIGHICTIEFQSGQSQQILSYKHHTGSSSTFGIFIDELAEGFFKITNDSRYIKMLPKVNPDGMQLVIDRRSLRGFEHVQRIDSWEQVSPSRISWIHEILLIDKDGDATGMAVADEENRVHLTMDALKFLSATDYKVKSNGDYVFDLTGWDTNLNMFGIPKVQFNVLEYTKMLETFIKGPSTGSRKDNQATILDFTNPIAALAAFHDLTAQMLSTPLSHLQVVLLSTTCEDPENGDFRLPKDKMKGVFTGNNIIMRNNSASVALGYENQETDIYKVSSYLGLPRPYHAADWLVLGDDAE